MLKNAREEEIEIIEETPENRMYINGLAERMKAEQVCKEIIAEVVKEGFRYQVSHKDLAKVIMFKRGIDERTVQRWINALVTFEYLIPETTSIFKVYKLNPLRVPEFFNNLKQKPQTKLS